MQSSLPLHLSFRLLLRGSFLASTFFLTLSVMACILALADGRSLIFSMSFADGSPFVWLMHFVQNQ